MSHYSAAVLVPHIRTNVLHKNVIWQDFWGQLCYCCCNASKFFPDCSWQECCSFPPTPPEKQRLDRVTSYLLEPGDQELNTLCMSVLRSMIRMISVERKRTGKWGHLYAIPYWKSKRTGESLTKPFVNMASGCYWVSTYKVRTVFLARGQEGSREGWCSLSAGRRLLEGSSVSHECCNRTSGWPLSSISSHYWEIICLMLMTELAPSMSFCLSLPTDVNKISSWYYSLLLPQLSLMR